MLAYVAPVHISYHILFYCVNKSSFIYLPSCVHAQPLQSCLTLYNPMALQAPLSMGFSRQEYWSGLPFPPPVIKYEVSEVSKVKLLSHARLFVTLWTVAYQAPPSMGFSRQEYWSGCQFLLQFISLLMDY